MEGLFEDRFIQPFIHEAHVTLRDKGSKHQFLVFCQNHLHLSVNTSIGRERNWRGDIVVMRLGIKDPRVINMRTGDGARVDYMVKQ